MIYANSFNHMFNHMALEPRCGALRPGALQFEDVSEKAAYRGGAWSSAPVHPAECGGGLECVALLNFYLKCIVTVAQSK